MRALLRTFTVAAMASVLLSAAPAYAADGVVIDWGQYCFGWETAYSGHISSPGSQLTIVGKILTFYDPFDDLDPATTEYTFIFQDLVSLGTMDYGGVVYETYYSGGTFEIYEDPTNDYDFGTSPPNATSPSTFINGTLVLEGTLANFYVMMSLGPGGYSGTFTADFDFTGPVGGELYGRVEGCYGALLGNWTDDPGIVLPGYDIHTDGKFDIDDCRPTATDQSSWGSIKGLFH